MPQTRSQQRAASREPAPDNGTQSTKRSSRPKTAPVAKSKKPKKVDDHPSERNVKIPDTLSERQRRKEYKDSIGEIGRLLSTIESDTKDLHEVTYAFLEEQENCSNIGLHDNHVVSDVLNVFHQIATQIQSVRGSLEDALEFSSDKSKGQPKHSKSLTTIGKRKRHITSQDSDKIRSQNPTSARNIKKDSESIHELSDYEEETTIPDHSVLPSHLLEDSRSRSVSDQGEAPSTEQDDSVDDEQDEGIDEQEESKSHPHEVPIPKFTLVQSRVLEEGLREHRGSIYMSTLKQIMEFTDKLKDPTVSKTLNGI